MAKQIIYQGKIDNLLLDVSDLEIEIVRGDVDHLVLHNCETSLLELQTLQSRAQPSSSASRATPTPQGVEFVSLREQLQLGAQQTTLVVKQIASFWHGKRRRPIWTSVFMRPKLRIVLSEQTLLAQLDINQSQGASTLVGIELGKVHLTLDNAKMDFINCQVQDLRLQAYLTHFNWNGSRITNSFTAQLKDARCTALGSMQPMRAQVHNATGSQAQDSQVEFANVELTLSEQGAQYLRVNEQLEVELLASDSEPVQTTSETLEQVRGSVPQFSWTCASSMLMWN